MSVLLKNILPLSLIVALLAGAGLVISYCVLLAALAVIGPPATICC